MRAMIEFLRRTLTDEDATNDGKVFSLPFLFAAWGLGVADGVMSIVRGHGAMEAAVTLATVGFALFTGDKMLRLKGQTPEPEETPEEAA